MQWYFVYVVKKKKGKKYSQMVIISGKQQMIKIVVFLLGDYRESELGSGRFLPPITEYY